MANLTEMEKFFKQLLINTDDKKNDNNNHGMLENKKKWKHKNIKKLNIDKSPVKNQISKKSLFDNTVTKNLNVDATLDDYMSVFDSFECVLSNMKVDKDSRPKILTKLKSLRKIIQIKIQHLTVKDKSTMNIFSKHSFSENSQSTSIESFCSESFCFNSEYFFSQISCPFCSKLQMNQTYFIKHLDEDCERFRSKNFSKKQNQIPFSYFQILPNNTFKCNVCQKSVSHNIEDYFTHKTSDEHFSKMRSNKAHTEDLFCSACKILVPNTYIQLKCHINHPIHEQNRNETDISNFFSLKQVSLVYIHYKRFKCIVCPEIVRSHLNDLLIHSRTNTHKKNLNEKLRSSDVLYCIICDNKFENPLKFAYHLKLEEHKQKERESKEAKSFELCFYCGFKTANLMSLSTHMTIGCDGIKEIRDSLKVKSEENNAIKSKKKSAVDVTELKSNDGTDERCIWIKGCTEPKKLMEVVKFFHGYGDVASYKLCNDKNLMIQFKQRAIADQMLAIREAIGLKLGMEIISSLDGTSESENDDREPDSTDSDSDSSSDGGNLADLSWVDQNLQSLFQRVSSHLCKFTQKPDSTTEQQIIEDCVLTLKCKKCIVLGFGAKGLSFPTDRISFFCDFGDSTSEFKNEEKSFDKLCKESYGKLSNSKLWEDIEIITDSWYCLKCKHVATQKTCTILFHSDFVELTDMLGSVLVHNKSFQPFFLIVRLWFAVHKFSLGNSEYPLISLLIFFLINSKMVSLFNPSNLIYKKISRLAMEETSEVPIETVPVPDISKLFRNFLKFLLDFDFSTNAICLPYNSPLPIQILKSSWFQDSLGISILHFTSGYLCIINSPYSINLGSQISLQEFQSILKIAEKTLQAAN